MRVAQVACKTSIRLVQGDQKASVHLTILL